jgi:sulfite dehydrogenase
MARTRFVQTPAAQLAKRPGLMFIAALCTVGLAHAQTPESLLLQNKCYSCHADRETKTGPAYADVAAKYRGKADAVEVVAATVRKGAHGSGPWHMPPHPEISRTDALAMARYILSLKR